MLRRFHAKDSPSPHPLRMKRSLLIIACIWSVFCCQVCLRAEENASSAVRCGADRTEEYLHLIEGKRVGLVVNHTSVIASDYRFVPLPDTLLKLGVDVRCIFAPEHGYKGMSDAGEHVRNGSDAETGLKIYSLYGKNKKPQKEQVEDIDVIVFDMQDVGARFYTYLSTLYYVIKACQEFQKELIVLDRPNPNDTVDGPMLDKKFESFVGIVPVPLLHGCTFGEMARMIAGEWLGEIAEGLTIIPCSGWKHGQPYDIPIAPSPNLPNPHAIGLYPSLCLFEGTGVSVGRGTAFPFEVYGHPAMKSRFSFTPRPSALNKNPLQNGKVCRGEDLRKIEAPHGFSLKYIIKAYKQLGTKLITSQSFFDRLAGTDMLRKQIMAGKSEAEIRKTWQKELNKYNEIRSKYLIYETQ